MITCEEIRSLLDLLSDSALESEKTAAIMGHLKECDPCQAEWQSMLALRTRMRQLRDGIKIPSNLMAGVDAALQQDKKRQSRSLLALNRSWLAAAGLALVCLVATYFCFELGSKPELLEVTALVDRQYASDPAFEPVANFQDLSKQLGYDIKFLKLGDWRLNQAGLYKAAGSVGKEQHIARFEFRRLANGQEQKLFCYQALAGSMRKDSLKRESVAGKSVWFGQRGTYSYACWTENGRDYLLISPFAQNELADLVHEA